MPRSPYRSRPSSPLMQGTTVFLRGLIRLRLLWIILLASLCLSGCVRYDVGIRFADANHGEIKQYIRLEQQSGMGDTLLQTWVKAMEQNVLNLGGQVNHPSQQEWLIQIPFYNARDLETKFNQFFQPPDASRPFGKATSRSSSGVGGSRLHLTTGNLILWQRNRLQYDLDLRGLQVPESLQYPSATSTLSPSIQLSLQTPWGAKLLQSNAIAPLVQKRGKQLVWQLQPGVINHLEAVFWVPSPLGIGTALIVAIVLAGGYRLTQMQSGKG